MNNKKQKNPFSDAPKFLHPQQMSYLYENGLRIDHNLLKEILALPQDDLLSDLEKVLLDALDRYDYFRDLIENGKHRYDEDYADRFLRFSVHALCLLQEINCERSLDIIFNFFTKKPSFELLDFYMDDHLTETLWIVFYHLGLGREKRLVDFILQVQTGDEFVKFALSTALHQIYCHHADKKILIRQLFDGMFQYILTNDVDDKILMPVVIAEMICHYVEMDPSVTSPLVKQLFDGDYVAIDFSGTYEELLDLYTDPKHKDFLKEAVFNIFELYHHIITTWSGYTDDYSEIIIDDEDDEEEDEEEDVFDLYPELLTPHPVQPIVAKLKVGRNDQCPCGSGKKYKKCCGAKE
jgi:hypothetical protein